MVKLSERGELLAARGPNAEQLADSASLIHCLLKAIASDLGRHGRASVHLSGGGQSLLVLKNEARELAAARGPSSKLRDASRKAGLP